MRISIVTLDFDEPADDVSAAKIGDGKLGEAFRRIGGLQGLLALLKLFGVQVPDVPSPPAK